MATYKVLQDIEAEDTLVGPLTLRQCIYAAIAAVNVWLSYLVISKGAPYLAVVFIPFILVGVFFAFPWTKQQTTEVWALAKIRFYLKPRKRIWNQSGVKQLVTITAPKKARRAYTRNLSPDEVQNRLRALADTIDSRGWAVKNVELGYYPQPSVLGDSGSDRLIEPTAIPQEVPSLDPDAASDIFDTANSPVAHKFDALMSQSAGNRHEELVQQMAGPAQPEPAAITQYWHMKTIQPPSATDAATTDDLQTAAGQATNGRQAPGYTRRKIQATAQSTDYTSLRTPGGSMPARGATTQQSDSSQSTDQTVTDQPNPAILDLANNKDLSVATIAREAKARTAGPDDEVVVDLH